LSKLFLVTGGAGFIGSHLAERLVQEGRRVRIIDNLTTGKRENIELFLPGVEFIPGDIRDLELVRRAMDGVDYVLHQAAIPSVPRSVMDPLATNTSNVDGTLNVLFAAQEAEVKRVIYASSSSVYGDSPVLPKSEEMLPEPCSPYAVSKLAGELYCQAFYRVYGLETVALRYFNVFGSRQDPDSQYAGVVPKFVRLLLHGDPPTIFGDGEQSRDFTYVDNVVDANLLAVEAEGVSGEVFNIACGERLTVNSLAAMLGDLIGAKHRPIYAPPRAGDVRHSVADVAKATTLLGYTPAVTVREGLKRTLDWFMVDSDSKGMP
jgi:nucleoside-diphosphate-sugar epimerase